MPLVALAAKLRAIALSEISQMLNETLPYRVQRNFARLGRAQRLLLPGKLQFVGRRFLVGAGDFSPPNGYVFGTEVPCSEGFEPHKSPLADKEGTGSKTVLIMQSIVKSLGHM